MSILGRLNIEAEYAVKTIIEAIRENRKKHVAEYKEAMDGYFTSMEKKLASALKDNSERKPLLSALYLPVPIDNRKNYDDLERLFMSVVGETIKLDSSEFNQIVCDNHEWAVSAKATNSMYASAGAIRR